MPFRIEPTDGLPAAADDVLAIIRFGQACPLADLPPDAAPDPRLITVPLAEVGGRGSLEVWRAAEPVTSGTAAGISFAQTGRILLGHVAAEEGGEGEPRDLVAATHDLYRRLFIAMGAWGYPHIYRIWNYFPDINAEEAKLERYRAFCLGRHRALAERPDSAPGVLPAATAIGSRQPGLHLCILAGKSAGVQVENPRQVSAFAYPPTYGPKSPSFSRSILKSWGGGRYHLYISGTASIVGHRTRHPGNNAAQLAETLDNIEALLRAAGQRAACTLRLAQLRAYVRGEFDPALARRAVEARFGPVPMVMLRGDICRSDLLVELEGLAVGGPD